MVNKVLVSQQCIQIRSHVDHNRAVRLDLNLWQVATKSMHVMNGKQQWHVCVFCNQRKKFRHIIIFEGDEIVGGTHAEEIWHNHCCHHCHHHHDSRSFQVAPAEFNTQDFCKYKMVQSPNSLHQIPELLQRWQHGLVATCSYQKYNTVWVITSSHHICRKNHDHKWTK